MTLGTRGVAPVDCAAPVSRNGVSHQAAPNNSLGSKSPGRLPRSGDCGPKAPRPRYSCVPHAGSSKRQDRAVASGLSSGVARHAGSPVARSLLSLSCARPESCRGPIKTTRSGALTQPGARAPSGPTSSLPGGAFVPGCLSSVVKLPDTPGYPLVLSIPSPLSLIGGAGRARTSHGTGWPSRSYSPSTA